jgi:predicted ester cyclase
MAGVPPTGGSVKLEGINMFRASGGRVVEQWAELDMLGRLQQLGTIPT